MSIFSSDMNNKNKFLRTRYKKILFIVILVIVISFENSIIYLVEPIESKIVYTNWILLTNSSVAAGLSVLLVVTKVLKHKFLDIHTRIHLALAIGLVLWLCANIQWSIYELEEVVPDVPSIADFFWLSAYPFLGYSLYFAFKDFYRKYRNKYIFVLTILCNFLLVTYIIYITVGLSVFTSVRGIILFSIIIAYPILNIILITPAISMLLGFRHETEKSIPRMFESLSLVSLVLADSWFMVIFLSGVLDAIWLSNLLIVDHYVIISGGLLWSLVFLNPISNRYILKWKNWLVFGNILSRVRILISILALISSIFFVSLFYGNLDYSSSRYVDSVDFNPLYPNGVDNEIKIGALLGLSGSAYESGKTQKAVLLQAVDDINKNFSDSNIHKKVVLEIENTEIKPNVAVAKIKKFVEKGIRIIIGPQTSNELNAIKEYADEHDVLIISQSSTAPSLSKKDNIFRLLQNDNYQGKQIAEKMKSDGIEIVVPILRNDQYGDELYKITEQNFRSSGGKFSNETVRKFSNETVKYDPHVGKFAASLHRINFIVWDQELKDLNLAVLNAKKLTQNDSKVAVYVISYGEIVSILIQAPSHTELEKVKWYGSEATAKNERLLKHQQAIEFASKTKFLSPLLSVNDTNKKMQLLEKVTKLELNPNDANVYDALWIAALSESKSGNSTFKVLKNNFNEIIDSYHGVSGIIKLDTYGDRIGNYDFWRVNKDVHTNNYEWEKINQKEHK